MFGCMRDPEAEPVKLILTSPIGFTAAEEDKVRSRLRVASWGMTSVTVRRQDQDLVCTFRSASRNHVENLYSDITPKLRKDFIGPWSVKVEGGV